MATARSERCSFPLQIIACAFRARAKWRTKTFAPIDKVLAALHHRQSERAASPQSG
jgi:hypothetical protein